MESKEQFPMDEDLFVSGLIPVVHFTAVDQVEPYLELLLASNLTTVEITLRDKNALEIVEAALAFRNASINNRSSTKKTPVYFTVGVGTIVCEAQLEQVAAMKVDYALSPGIDVTLIEQARTLGVPFIPGVATASEIMLGLRHQVRHFKLFPSSICGGVSALNAFAGPFPDARFCPTGGVTPDNLGSFLSLKNVFAVGGSWIADKALLQERDWDQLAHRLRHAMEIVHANSQ